MASAATDVASSKIAFTGHGLVDDTPIVFDNTVGTTGYTDGTTYYVCNTDHVNGDFKISTTLGGGGVVAFGGVNGTTDYTTVLAETDDALGNADDTPWADPLDPESGGESSSPVVIEDSAGVESGGGGPTETSSCFFSS